MYTTLNRIHVHRPPTRMWEKLLRNLGKTEADDQPLSFVAILDSNGLDDALWCCRAEPQHASLWRHFAVDCAEAVQHLVPDERSWHALEVARRHAEGKATDVELQVARDAISATACDAAWCAARDPVWEAAQVAAWRAAGVAAWEQANGVVGYVVWLAALAAARVAAEGAFADRFRHLVTAGVWTPMQAEGGA